MSKSFNEKTVFEICSDYINSNKELNNLPDFEKNKEQFIVSMEVNILECLSMDLGEGEFTGEFIHQEECDSNSPYHNENSSITRDEIMLNIINQYTEKFKKIYSDEEYEKFKSEIKDSDIKGWLWDDTVIAWKGIFSPSNMYKGIQSILLKYKCLVNSGCYYRDNKYADNQLDTLKMLYLDNSDFR